MEAQGAEEEKFNKKLELANKAKEAYLQLYKELVENLSLEHLEDIVNIFKDDNVTFDKEKLLTELKENLLKIMVTSTDRSWVKMNIADNIAALESMKDECRNHNGPNWRPTGKTIEEQTLPTRVQKLDAVRKHLQKQVDFQNAKLEELLRQNTMFRNGVEQVKVQRSVLREHMQRGTAELQNVKAEYKDLILQILNEED